jgi:hypothetical protein
MRRLAVLATLALAAPAAADEVVLRNGAVFSGIVREEGDRVVVQLDFGTMTFKKIDVRSIVRSDDPLKEFDQKVRAAEGAQGHYEVAMWARDKGLTTRSNEVLKKVLAIDPEHEGARKALGFEKVDGKWLEGDELMVARGFVKYNGRWLKRETAERLLEGDRAVAVETDRRQLEQRAIDAQREVELAKIALERQRLEAERERCGWSWSGGYLWGAWVPSPCRCRRHVHGGAHPPGVIRATGLGQPGQPLPPVKETVVPHPAPTVVPIPAVTPAPLPKPR